MRPIRIHKRRTSMTDLERKYWHLGVVFIRYNRPALLRRHHCWGCSIPYHWTNFPSWYRNPSRGFLQALTLKAANSNELDWLWSRNNLHGDLYHFAHSGRVVKQLGQFVSSNSEALLKALQTGLCVGVILFPRGSLGGQARLFLVEARGWPKKRLYPVVRAMQMWTFPF